jgi:hypothetical protein
LGGLSHSGNARKEVRTSAVRDAGAHHVVVLLPKLEEFHDLEPTRERNVSELVSVIRFDLFPLLVIELERSTDDTVDPFLAALLPRSSGLPREPCHRLRNCPRDAQRSKETGFCRSFPGVG